MKPRFRWEREFQEFIDSLPVSDRVRILKLITLIEGQDLSVSIKTKKVKKLEDNLFEIRSFNRERSLRIIYFQLIGNHYFLTHGFTKKTQKTPKQEIEKAKRIRTYILNRKDDPNDTSK